MSWDPHLRHVFALGFAASMAMPLPLVAQQAEPQPKVGGGAPLQDCAGATSFPCVRRDGAVMISQSDMMENCADATDFPCLRQDGMIMPSQSEPLKPDEQQRQGREQQTARRDQQDTQPLPTVAGGAPLQECAGTSSFPCVRRDGTVMISQSDMMADCAVASGFPCLRQDGMVMASQSEPLDPRQLRQTNNLPDCETATGFPCLRNDGKIIYGQPQAAAADADEEGEVRRETVTEETVRSSDEEFQTRADEQIKDDEGLSNFEKFALGAGAIALGALLDNGGEVVSNTGDRVVVRQPDGNFALLKDDDAILRRPGADVQTRTYSDGSTRTTITYDDGSEVHTIRGTNGLVLRRVRVTPQGEEVVLFDDTGVVEEVNVANLPRPRERSVDYGRSLDDPDLRDALQAELRADLGRTFSLRQVREIDDVRKLVPQINLEAIDFETASAAIRPEEARELADLGIAIRDVIDRNPRAVFLVEGHTDAVGGAAYNLALSDRRAESVALALTEYFDVPPHNLLVQGYGESDLKIETQQAERANRRAVVRNITPLLRQSAQFD